MRRPSGWRSLLVSLSLSCLGIWPPAAPAQGNGGEQGLSISGYVTDDNSHQSVKGVALEIIRASGGTPAPPVMSGITGEFRFAGLVSGDYRIAAHLNGYEPTTVNVTLGGTPLANVSVTVHRIDSTNDLGPGDAISAHQLSVPQSARDDFDKGMKLLLSAPPNYRKALTSFERAIREFPDYYEAYAETGVAHQRLGEAAEAENALRKSVEMSQSRYPDALFLLAEMLNDASRFPDAEGFARQCVLQDDSLWSCDLELARALAGMRRPAEAEVAARKAIEINPNSAKNFLVLGNIHIQQHRFEAVVQDFDAYLKLDSSGPLSESVRVSLAQARKAIAHEPSNTPVAAPR